MRKDLKNLQTKRQKPKNGIHCLGQKLWIGNRVIEKRVKIIINRKKETRSKTMSAAHFKPCH